MELVDKRVRVTERFLLNLFFFVIGTILLVFSFSQNNIYVISSLCVLQLGINMTWLLKNGFSWLSLPMIFLLLLFLFHGSYYILWLIDGFGLENQFTQSYSHIYLTIADETWVDCGKFCILFFFFFTMGITFCRKRVWTSKKVFSFEQCRKIGIVVTTLCLLPRIYLDVYTLFLYLQGGYLATFSGIPGFLQTLADGFYIGIILMILGAPTASKAKNFLLLGIAVSLFGMLSGRRMEKVVYVIALFFVYMRFAKNTKTVKKVKTKSKIAWFLVAYLFLVAISTFGDVRATSDFSIGLINLENLVIHL